MHQAELTKEPLVQISRVTTETDHGDILFRDLDFTLPSGRSAIITGSPGSGKSTLAALLTGTAFPLAGTIECFGETISRRRSRAIQRIRRKIGGVGGMFGLVPAMTVSENVTLPLIIAGERATLRHERVNRTLTEMGLVRVSNQPPARLTRVEYTLVQIARAVAANKPLILLDEPSAGLDAATYQTVLEQLVRVSVAGSSILILTTELPPRDIPNCDKYTLKDGRLV